MDASQIANLVSIVVAVLVLVGALTVGYIIFDAHRRNRSALKSIADYVHRQGFSQQMVSFEAIRAYVNDAYDDSFLIALAKTYPNELRLAYLKDPESGKNTRSGVQVLSNLQAQSNEPGKSRSVRLPAA